MSKKILSIVLTLVLALSTFIPVSAAESTPEDYVDTFVDAVMNMPKDGKQGLIQSVKAFSLATNRKELKDVFKNALNELNKGQRERIDSELQLTENLVDVVNTLVDYSLNENGKIDNFASYINEGKSDLLKKSLNSRGLGNQLKNIKGLTCDTIKVCINKSSIIFHKLVANQVFDVCTIINLYEKDNTMQIDRTNLDKMMDYMRNDDEMKDGSININDTESIKNAAEVLKKHYNDGNNQQAIISFLDYYHFINLIEDDESSPSHSSSKSSGGGGGGGASLPTGNVKEIVKDVEKVKSEGSAYKVVSNVKYAMDKLAKDAGKLSKRAEVVSNTKALLESINKVGDMIDSRSYAQQSLTNVTATIEKVNDVIKELKNDEDVNGIITELKDTVNVTAGLMAKADNVYKAKDTANKLIISVGALNRMNKGDERILGQINEELVNVANEAVSNASVCKISGSHVKVTNGQASANISTQELDKSINEMNKVRDELRSAFLKQNIKISTPIAKSVAVDVAEINGAKEVKATLPSLTEVMKKVDNVKVKTQNAVFNIDNDTFTPSQLAKELTFTAGEVEKVSEQLKKQMPENTVVVELNAAVDNKKVTEFNKPIEVTIPYTLGDKEDPMKIAVFNAKVDNTVEVVGGRYNEALQNVTFNTNHFSQYFAKENKKSFTDIRNNRNKEYIEALACKGYINGKMDTRFAPNDNITRAEFVTLITQMYKLEGNVNELQFTDVAKDAWYAPYVAAAVQEGYVSGRSNTTFAPDELITNQEMVALAVNILKTNGYSNIETDLLERFNDNDEVSTWAVAPMRLAYYLGIFDGEANDTLQPKTPATRADAAAIMYKIFALN